MATIAKNAVGQYATFTGTGVVTLSGAAIEGARTFSVYADGAAGIPVMLQEMDVDGARGFPVAWELVQCTYDATAGTLARGAVYASSNAGAAVSFGVGIKRAFVALVADDVVTPADLAAGLATKASMSHTQAASTISDSTTAGRALLTAANAAAQRTALGLATVAATGAYSDLTGAPGATHDDWIAGVEMYQDALATTPVTAQGQRLRAWKSPTGRTLLATQSGGMLVQRYRNVLTPHCRPDGSGVNYGGLHLSGGSSEPSIVHLITHSSSGKYDNFYVTDAPTRTNEAFTYNDLAALVYAGGAVVSSTTYAALANQTLFSVTHGHSAVTAYRDGVQIATVAGASYAFPLALHVLNGAVGPTRGGTFVERIRISPVANAAADFAELSLLVAPKPARRIAVISDSQFTAVFGGEGGGISNELARYFSVLPNSTPGGALAQITAGDCNAQVIAFDPECLIYCATNDLMERTAAQLMADILASAAAIGTDKIIVVTPWLRTATFGSGGEANYTAQCAAFDALAKASTQMIVVSGYDLITGDRLASDGVHCTGAGRDALIPPLIDAINTAPICAVAELPTTPRINDKRTVKDALAPAYNSTVAAGGARLVDVTYDGTNWVCS